MAEQQRQFEMSDQIWDLLQPHLPGQQGQWGRAAKDNRQFINGVFWVLKTGSPWRELPVCYGKWGTVYQRFRRWREKKIWETLLEILVDQPDFEWLIITVNYYKAQPHTIQAKSKNQRTSCTRNEPAPRLSLPWMQMVCQSEYLAQRVPELIEKKLSAELLVRNEKCDADGERYICVFDTNMSREVPLKREPKRSTR